MSNFWINFLGLAANLCIKINAIALLIGGLLFGIAIIGAINSEEHRAKFGKLMLISILFGLMPFVVFNFLTQPYFKYEHQPFPAFILMYFLAAAALGSAVTLGFLRTVSPWISEKASRLKKGTALERNEKTDVRRIHEFLPAPVGRFDPLSYWRMDKGFFIGLDEHKKPSYWPGDLPHIQVAGTSGSGKGVFLSMLAGQCAWRGEPTIYLDPKDDEWAPHVLSQLCAHLRIPFHLIDLRPTAGPQLNLFENATQEQIEELFLAGFSLSEKGKDSDFYTIADRRAAGDMARLLAGSECTPASIYTQHGEALEGSAAKFAGMLREMAELPAVNAKPNAGLDLQEFIQGIGVIYVIGSMRNAKIIRLQRMFLVKLIQLAEQRDRTYQNKKIAIILDEAKYHISRPALEALGAARDKGVHVMVAHQSLDDLRDCPADLSPDAVVGAVMENCALKLAYRIQDPVTAEYFARKSGRIQADDEMRRISRNAALSEMVAGDRTIRQAERFLIDENMLLNLHRAQGVLFGHGLPQFIHTSPILVDKLPADQLKPKVVPGDQLKTASELISQPKQKGDPFVPHP